MDPRRVGVARRQLIGRIFVNFADFLLNIFRVSWVNIRAINGSGSDQFADLKKDNYFLCKVIERHGIPRNFANFF